MVAFEKEGGNFGQDTNDRGQLDESPRTRQSSLIIMVTPPMQTSGVIQEIMTQLGGDATRPCVSDPNGALSRDALRARSGAAGLGLLRRGLRQGQRILLAVPPGIPFVTVALGALRIGASIIPVSPKASEHQLAHVLHDSGPRLAIAQRPIRERIQKLAPAIRTLTPSEVTMRAPTWAMQTSDAGITCKATEPAVILYTSGTTGAPKGVVHTHGSLAANLAALRETWRWQSSDRLLLALPLFHLHGLVVGLLGSLYCGASVHLLPRFEAATVRRELTRQAATLFFGVPTMYRQLSELDPPGDLHRLRLVVSGSAPLPPRIRRAFETRFGRPILQRYGTSETGIVLSQPIDDPPGGADVGHPLPHTEIRIVAPNQNPGDEREPGEVHEGELWVRSRALFAGYYEDDDATSRALQQGYYRTGDWVRRQPDGSIVILGRLSGDVIKVHGHKVGAVEIETVLNDHAAVAECAVVGMADPDAGERVIAFVLPVASHAASAESLRTHLATHLAPYQVPQAIYFVTELPRIGPGKVDKRRLRQDAIARSEGRHPSH